MHGSFPEFGHTQYGKPNMKALFFLITDLVHGNALMMTN